MNDFWIVLAVIGETFSEKSGFINLSLDGTILFSAMGAFAVAVQTDSLLAGASASTKRSERSMNS